MSTHDRPWRTAAHGLALAGFLCAATAWAHDTAQPKTELFKPGMAHAGGNATGGPAGRPPLYAGLGPLTMPVTTASTEAQAYFDQGLRLTWAFNHAEALRAFREAQRLDAACAMCAWGEAFALGPNINSAMDADVARPAYEASRRALALVEHVTPKERALIGALAVRYAPNSMAVRPPLDRAWAEAMAGVAAAYPDDTNILVLYADAMMNLQPWDYWEADGVTPKGDGGKIVAVLEHALAIDPDHPAAAHLYIHAVEASADPGRAEWVADRLRGAAPGAGHLVHMPAHIYTRVGRHADSIAVNRDAVAADEAFLAAAGAEAGALYRFGYYPHNLHFLMVSAQMAGLREDVIASAEKLAEVTSDDVSAELAWVQAIRTAPYAAHAQLSNSVTILALPDPGARFPFVRGFWHYARGVAFAFGGEIEAAWSEVAAIERIIVTADLSRLEAQHLPARDVLGVAKHLVEARIEQARRDFAAAEHHLRESIARQDGLPYIEPPYWHYPVRQTLAAVLLQQGRAEEATTMFVRALSEAPRNGWAMWGLLQARIAASDPAVAETRAAFREAWLGDPALLRLDRL